MVIPIFSFAIDKEENWTVPLARRSSQFVGRNTTLHLTLSIEIGFRREVDLVLSAINLVSIHHLSHFIPDSTN
jgi:hypothetical protein